MRIAVVAWEARGVPGAWWLGGLGVYSVELCAALAGLGCDVTLITLAAPGSRAGRLGEHRGFEVVAALPVDSADWASASLAACSLLSDLRPDAVIVLDPHMGGSLLCAKALGARVVYSSHMVFYEPIQTLACYADRLVVSSARLAAELHSFLHAAACQHLPPTRAVYPRPRRLPAPDPGAVEELRGGADVVVSAVGRRDPNKNHELLVGAAELLAGWRGCRVRVVLAGYGYDRGLQRRSQRVEVLTLPQLADDRELAAVYAASDAHALPSVSEGFGMTPLEAALLGTPSAVSRGCGCLEVLPAPTFDPGSPEELAAALDQLLSGRGGWLSRQRRAVERLGTWRDLAREYLELLEL